MKCLLSVLLVMSLLTLWSCAEDKATVVAAGATLYSDGTLDTTFDTDGIYTVDLTGGGLDDRFLTSKMQADGKIIFAGEYRRVATQKDMLITRYNSDGTIDTDFGTAGKTLVDFNGGNDSVRGIAIDTSGNIFVCGRAPAGDSKDDWGFAKLDSSGVLDTSFGTGGKFTVEGGDVGGKPFDIVVDSSGKIVAGGYYGHGADSRARVVRLSSAGALDNTFGTGGIADAPTKSVGFAMTAVAGGGYVVAGYDNSGAGDTPAYLAKFDSDGAVDTTFGTNGEVSISMGGNDSYSRVIELSDGRIIAAGSHLDAPTTPANISRYSATGVLDTAFGTSGHWLLANHWVDGIAVQSDGKIVFAGGHTTGGLPYNPLVGRLDTDGVLDTTFASNGLYINTDYTISFFTSVLIQSDNKILAPGLNSTDGGGTLDVMAMRFWR